MTKTSKQVAGLDNADGPGSPQSLSENEHVYISLFNWKVDFCKVCGVELTSENRYLSGKNRYRKKCKDCLNKERREKYKKRINRYTLKLPRGVRHFNTKQEKHEFLVGRGIQAKYGRVHISPSSNVGKTVWVSELVETKSYKSRLYPEKMAAKPLKVSRPLVCPYCDGIVCYEARNEQVCTECGTVVNAHFNVEVQEQDRQLRKKSQIPILEQEDKDFSEKGVTKISRYNWGEENLVSPNFEQINK